MGAVSYHLIILQFGGRELEILPTTLSLSSDELKLLLVLVYLCHVSSSQKRNSEKLNLSQVSIPITNQLSKGQAHIEEGSAPGYQQLFWDRGRWWGDGQRSREESFLKREIRK